MGAEWFSDEVFSYLSKNKDVEVTIQELMEVSGRSREQVQGSVGNLRRRKGANIDTPVPGRVYIYRGMGQPRYEEMMPSNNSIASPVLKVLQDNRGKNVTISQLLEETGLEAHKIRNAINHMKARGLQVRTIIRGQAWVFEETDRPVPTPDPVVQKIVEKVYESTEETPKVTPTPPPSVERGKFVMPRPHADNEFMRVISRKPNRVVLEDAEGTIWIANEL